MVVQEVENRMRSYLKKGRLRATEFGTPARAAPSCRYYPLANNP